MRRSPAFLAASLPLLLAATPALAKSKEPSVTNLLIGLGCLVVFAIITALATQNGIERLEDPNDDNVLYLDQLAGKAQLAGGGQFQVTIYRQSGNVHSRAVVTGSAADAVRTALSTFCRAKIDSVGVRKNTSDELSFARLFHNHRGSNEGKKVGAAHIVRLA